MKTPDPRKVEQGRRIYAARMAANPEAVRAMQMKGLAAGRAAMASRRAMSKCNWSSGVLAFDMNGHTLGVWQNETTARREYPDEKIVVVQLYSAHAVKHATAFINALLDDIENASERES